MSVSTPAVMPMLKWAIEVSNSLGRITEIATSAFCERLFGIERDIASPMRPPKSFEFKFHEQFPQGVNWHLTSKFSFERRNLKTCLACVEYPEFTVKGPLIIIDFIFRLNLHHLPTFTNFF